MSDQTFIPSQSTKAVIELGLLSMQFSRVDRLTFMEDGVTPESDTDHTVMLGLVACAFAERHLPKLRLGFVAQYALIHDLVEVYAGDTPTLKIDEAGRRDKEAREKAALTRIQREFAGKLPWVGKMIAYYEMKLDPEARYVKAIDKLLPKITHIANNLATARVLNMTQEELRASYDEQFDAMMKYASDFPEVMYLREELIGLVMELCEEKHLLPTRAESNCST